MEKHIEDYTLSQHAEMNGDTDVFTQKVTVTEIVRRDRYLTYKEKLDDHEINVVLRVSDDSLKIQRRGVINMNFYFVEGRTTDTFYESPAGRHHYQLKTDKIEVTDDEIYVRYTLYDGSDVLGKYKYRMKKVG